MTNELCPSCHEIREMHSSSSFKVVTQSDGEEKKIVTVSFSCTKCGQFVRSEDHEKVDEE